jgi:8-oxo-dGTP diphosphatase
VNPIRYRRRGTAIVETPTGSIIVTSGSRKDASKKDRKPFILPGGGAERGETRFIAALRELKEETSLQPYAAEIIFLHKGKVRPTMSGRGNFQDHHTVCVVKASGKPKPNMHDVKQIDYYYPGCHIWISKTTKEIIERYYAWKSKKLAWEPSEDPDENDSDVVNEEPETATNDDYDTDEQAPAHY